jgi:hypothetical protein
MAAIEFDIVNKIILGGVLGVSGFILGEAIECGIEGKGTVECILGKAGDDLASTGYEIFKNFTLPGQIIKQTGVDKYDYKSLIGTVPSLGCNSDQQGQQGFCYNNNEIPSGYTFSSLGRFTKSCNAGQRDDGISCFNDIKGRGGGYPWKFGDGFNLDGAYGRCQADNGQGNCETYGAIVYPKCQHLYGNDWTNEGCCLCKNINGLSNPKETKFITPRTVSQHCPDGTVNHSGLCYNEAELLKNGYSYSSPGIYSKLKDTTISNPSNNSSLSLLPSGLGLLGLGFGVYVG